MGRSIGLGWGSVSFLFLSLITSISEAQISEDIIGKLAPPGLCGLVDSCKDSDGFDIGTAGELTGAFYYPEDTTDLLCFEEAQPAKEFCRDSKTLIELVCGDDYFPPGNPHHDRGGSMEVDCSAFGMECSQGACVAGFDGRVWKKFELTIEGPEMSETDGSSYGTGFPKPIVPNPADPNPFVDYRFEVSFLSPGGKVYTVPGFFDGDGQGNGAGNIWKVRFTPDEEGDWTYEQFFYQLMPGGDDPIPLNGNGEVGSFNVGPAAEDQTGFFKTGRLAYDGTVYPKTMGDQKAFIKIGANSPENFLAYYKFHETSHHGVGVLHKYSAHIDPTTSPIACAHSGEPVPSEYQDLEEIICAIDYLSSEGVNFIYLLLYNVGGDAKDVWPWVDAGIHPSGTPDNDNTHFSIKKLTQWNQVFEWAMRRGVGLHFLLGETETLTKVELDHPQPGQPIGDERKLFYEEMLRRFGYLPGAIWDFSEEFDANWELVQFSGSQILDYANYFQEIDWREDRLRGVHQYQNPITTWEKGYPTQSPANQLFGKDEINFASIQWAPSAKIQYAGENRHVMEAFYLASKASGKPVAAALDEPALHLSAGNLNHVLKYRREVIWPSFLNKAWGVELFVSNQDQSLENFKLFDDYWKSMKIGKDFIETFPLGSMEPMDSLVSGPEAEVLAEVGAAYAVYLPSSGNPTLSLPAGDYEYQWYDPQVGQYSATKTFSLGADGSRTFNDNPFGSADAVLRVLASD